MRRIHCSEIWGGIRNYDGDVETGGITASLYSSAAEGGKGGDIYFLSVCGSDMLTRIAVADVVGHGSAVAQTSQWMYEALQRQMNDLAGNGVLERVNRQASDHGDRAIGTAAVAAFYLGTSNLYFAYAGHHPLLVRRSGKTKWREAVGPERDEPANLPLGVDVDTPFDQHQMPLTSGDRLFLYTDGVIEAPARDGDLFGADRLMRLLNEVGDRPLAEVKSAVLDAVRDHTGGDLSHDDVTLLAVEVN